MKKFYLFVQNGCEDCEKAVNLLKNHKVNYELFKNTDHEKVTKYNILVLPTLVKSNIINGDEVFSKLYLNSEEELVNFLIK